MAEAATNKALIPVLVTLMLLTGVCNTLLTKYQVKSSTERRNQAYQRRI